LQAANYSAVLRLVRTLERQRNGDARALEEAQAAAAEARLHLEVALADGALRTKALERRSAALEEALVRSQALARAQGGNGVGRGSSEGGELAQTLLIGHIPVIDSGHLDPHLVRTPGARQVDDYHPVTARIYTDLSFFTADPGLTRDASKLFNYMTGYARPETMEKLAFSPLTTRPTLLALIRQEIAFAKEGPAGQESGQNRPNVSILRLSEGKTSLL
jgi:hypothetical protein